MSSIPGYELPDLPFWSFDKIVHLIEFGLLSMLVYRAFRFPRPAKHPYLIMLYLCIPFAALDELHQFFVPGRNCDVFDFIMDVAGLAVFGAVSARLNRPKSLHS